MQCYNVSGVPGGAVLPLEPRDDYSMYQYDTTLRLELPPLENKADEPNYFAGIKKWNDEKEVSRLFATRLVVFYGSKNICMT